MRDKVIIENFNLIKQKRNNTCGYATASMILAYLEEQSIDEDYLVDEEPFDERGITFLKLIEIYKKYLKIYKAEIIQEDMDKTLNIIKNSLHNKIPLHILYLTGNELGNNKFFNLISFRNECLPEMIKKNVPSLYRSTGIIS